MCRAGATATPVARALPDGLEGLDGGEAAAEAFDGDGVREPLEAI